MARPITPVVVTRNRPTSEGDIFGLQPAGHPVDCWHISELRLCKHFCSAHNDRTLCCRCLGAAKCCEICA